MARKTPKCHVFVGSSVENLNLADAVQENLDPHDACVTVWPQRGVRIRSSDLESLHEAVRSHDFGLFVFAPDDPIVLRSRKVKSVRDNIIFELGLFMGALGHERTFLLAPRGVDLHLPIDLPGWNLAEYDPNPRHKDPGLAASVACSRIRTAIQRLGPFRPGAPTRSVTTAAEIIQAPPPFTTTRSRRPLPKELIIRSAPKEVTLSPARKKVILLR